MRFIYFSRENQFVEILLSDLRTSKDVKIVDARLKGSNIILKAFRKMHLSMNINQVVNLPGKQIWLKEGFPELDPEEKYCLLFIDSVPMALDFSFLKKLRENSNGNIIFVLFFLNPVKLFEKRSNHDLSNLTFDYIFTYDFSDADKYGYIYQPAPYSIIQHVHVPVDKDLYLTCWNKGRISFLHDIYNLARNNGVSLKFRITGVEEKDQKFDEIFYNQRIEYEKVIDELSQCNCILDVLSPGHTGVSVRYYEAICYGKKLLTNNASIVDLPFYNKDYMRYFEKPEDIDWSWVRERVPIDYHYDGRYSPLFLLERIKVLEETKVRDHFAEEKTP